MMSLKTNLPYQITTTEQFNYFFVRRTTNYFDLMIHNMFLMEIPKVTLVLTLPSQCSKKLINIQAHQTKKYTT